MIDRSTNEMRSVLGTRAIAIALLAVSLVSVTLVPASADLVDRLEPVDDVTPGQRSAQEVCADEAGTECVNATLETSPFSCGGRNLTAFHCNLTYWLNLTVTGSDVCGNASVNVSEGLVVDACSGPVPGERVSSGAVTVTYNGTNISRVVNSTAWVCLEEGEPSSCERWTHDPILLPSWREWKVKPFNSGSTQRSNHMICLGTSGQLTAVGDPDPGCIEFILGSDAECAGPAHNYDCDLHVYLYAFVWWPTPWPSPLPGKQLCGVVSTSFEAGGDALACGFQYGGRSVGRYIDTRHYEPEEIPPGTGLSVVIEAEACAYAFRVDAAEYCETFHHVAQIDGASCCAGLDEYALFEVNHAMTTVDHTKPPGVYP